MDHKDTQRPLGTMTIPRRVLEVLGAASETDDSERYPVHLAGFTPDGAVAATDGWLWLRAKTGVKGLEQSVCLSAEDVMAVAAIADDGVVEIRCIDTAKAQVEMRNGGLVCSAAVLAETRPFPDVEKTIPTDPPLVTVDLQVPLFLKLFRILSRLNTGVVRLAFVGPERAIQIHAYSGQVPIDGCVMPMRKGSLELRVEPTAFVSSDQ